MAVKRYWPHGRPTRSFKITERKIKGLGLCHWDGSIEINPKQWPRTFLETLVHELLHRQFPMLSEESVEIAAVEIAESLWKMKYRRISE